MLRVACAVSEVRRFGVTPEQGRQAIEAGATMLLLGFDTMFVPAAVQLYLGQLNRLG